MTVPVILYHDYHPRNHESIQKFGLKAVRDYILVDTGIDYKGVNLFSRGSMTRGSSLHVKLQTVGVRTRRLDKSKMRYMGSHWYRYEGDIAPENLIF